MFGQDSGLPFYYRTVAGNIPDSKTLKHLLSDLQGIGYEKIRLAMDRGFYSRENVNALYNDHIKFLISVSMRLKFIREELDTIYDQFRSYDHYSSSYELYAFYTLQKLLDTLDVIECFQYPKKKLKCGEILKKQQELYLKLGVNPPASL